MGDISSENSYKSILKGSSLFVGVQVFQIIINLIRGKFVAMILGPDGMGLSTIFSSASNTLTRASSLGLNLAIVKEVAERRDNPTALSALMAVVGRMVQLTALGGCLICVLFSNWLSVLSFGTDAYAWQFVILSVAVYFSVVAAGRLSVLQGLHEVKRVSRASLVGALTGLFGGIPLYYFFGEKGIVPAIVLLAVTTCLFYTVNLRRVLNHPPMRVKLRDHKALLKNLLVLGMVLLAGDLIGSATGYLVNLYLRYFGGLDTVGLYNAANSMTNQYVGAVFTAMSLDYFPRLAAKASDNSAMAEIVNRQTEVVAMVMAPVACLVITSAPLIVRVLLSDSFMSVIPLLRWMGLGVVFRALQFPMGYISFAKDNKRLFFWLEAVLANVIYAGGIVFFYHYFGLIGLGYSFVIENLLAIFIYAIVNYRAYGYVISSSALQKGAVCTLMAFICFGFSFIDDIVISTISMSLVSLLSVVLAFRSIKNVLKQSK